MAGSQLLAQGIDRRRAIMRFVKAYIKRNGISPSLEEITEGVGSSKTTTRYHIGVLIDEGFLVQTEGKYRSLRVMNGGRYPA